MHTKYIQTLISLTQRGGRKELRIDPEEISISLSRVGGSSFQGPDQTHK